MTASGAGQSDEQGHEEPDLRDAVETALNIPMFILALVMLVLLIIELTAHLSPETRRSIILAQTAILWVFVLEYALRVYLSDDKWEYIRSNWLDAVIMLVPVLRVFRILRALRAVTFLRASSPVTLARTFVATRRGLRQLASALERRGFAYVVAITVVVFLVGSTAMYLLEKGAPHANIRTFGSAVWWSAGIITTIGNELYPVTTEGRVLATFVMIYAVGVFGYVAGTLASYFVHLDAAQPGGDPPIPSQQPRQPGTLTSPTGEPRPDEGKRKQSDRDSD